MKASEIVDKLKSVLLSAEEPQAEPAVEQEEQVELSVEEIEVNDAVELAEGEESPEGEAPAEEAPEQEPAYVTKDEFEAALAEMKAMYEAIIEKMGSEAMETEVPVEELSSQEEQVDLSADEPAAEPIAHSPESDSVAKPSFFKSAKPRNTMSVVYEKMFNK
jgi:hypothetical protein